jgi:hypothetical protein
MQPSIDSSSGNPNPAPSTGVSSRRRTIEAVVVAWFVFSVGYVIADQYEKFKTRNVTEHYERGRNDGRNEAVATLLELSEKCQPIDIAAGERKTQLIGVPCLKQQQQAPQAAAAVPAP